MERLLLGIGEFTFSGLLQVLALWCVYYYIFLFFRGTRGAQILAGLSLCLVVMIGVTQVANLDVLSWILRHVTVYLVIAILIIFHPEIRRALAELGKQPFFGVSTEISNVIDHVARAVARLAESKTGALIAIEREIGTRAIQETGMRLDARLDHELLTSIFFPHAPLHDGGVIITGDRIAAARCIFPLAEEVERGTLTGTRHRAAKGLSEETDAVVVVVSEETGTISGCFGGEFTSGMNEAQLRVFLEELLWKKSAASRGLWRRMRKHLDLTPRGIAKSERLKKLEEPDIE